MKCFREWILLGRHAENMLIAFADAHIHAYDNTMRNYPHRRADQGRYKHGREDVANRITRLRRENNESTSTCCNVTMYEDCHRMHVCTSQLHECNKCCLRYKTRSIKNPKSTHTETNTSADKDPKKHNLIRVCRFRAPWLERICKACPRKNKSLRYDICEDCFNEKVSTDANFLNVPCCHTAMLSNIIHRTIFHFKKHILSNLYIYNVMLYQIVP